MTKYVLMLLLLAGCAAEPVPESPETPHGYVEGAEETAEAQPRLVLADADGAMRVLDLVTEEVTELEPVDGRIGGISGDGRFAYLTGDDALHVVDGGAWLVDHADHVHYYRAEVRAVGTVPGRDVTGTHSDSAVSALSFGGRTVTLLDRAELERGHVKESGTVGGGVAVPYGEHLLVSEVDTVAVRTRTGEPVTTIGERCPEPHNAAVTRRGVVFSCADGALVVKETDGAFTGTRIPYPATGAAPGREFRHRRLSATLVAVADPAGVWSLDVAKRAWTLTPTGPVVAANTAGEGAPLLTLTADGVLHAYDPATGAEVAATPLLTAPLSDTPPVIEVDPARAYVNDATEGVVHEIDYNDNLRVARTFPLDITPTHLVETGR